MSAAIGMFSWQELPDNPLNAPDFAPEAPMSDLEPRGYPKDVVTVALPCPVCRGLLQARVTFYHGDAFTPPDTEVKRVGAPCRCEGDRPWSVFDWARFDEAAIILASVAP